LTDYLGYFTGDCLDFIYIFVSGLLLVLLSLNYRHIRQLDLVCGLLSTDFERLRAALL